MLLLEGRRAPSGGELPPIQVQVQVLVLVGGARLYLRSWMMVSASDWLLRLKSSAMAQLTLFSVVNIPLTSLYAHTAITRDCCRGGEGLVYGLGSGLSGSGGLLGETHRGDLRLLQGQPVGLPHVRVHLQHKHGDHALGGHDDHVGIRYGTVDDGRAQIHWDEVELFH